MMKARRWRDDGIDDDETMMILISDVCIDDSVDDDVDDDVVSGSVSIMYG